MDTSLGKSEITPILPYHPPQGTERALDLRLGHPQVRQPAKGTWRRQHGAAVTARDEEAEPPSSDLRRTTGPFRLPSADCRPPWIRGSWGPAWLPAGASEVLAPRWRCLHSPWQQQGAAGGHITFPQSWGRAASPGGRRETEAPPAGREPKHPAPALALPAGPSCP